MERPGAADRCGGVLWCRLHAGFVFPAKTVISKGRLAAEEVNIMGPVPFYKTNVRREDRRRGK